MSMTLDAQLGQVIPAQGVPMSMSGGYCTISGTTLTYAPATSPYVYLYVSSVWTSYLIGTGPTCSVTGLSASTAYYVYAYQSGGTVAVECVTTGTTTQNGILVKSGATDHLLLAYAYANASGVVTTYVQTASTQNLCNVYNKRRVVLIRNESAASWTYSSTSWHQANANTANQIVIVSDGTVGVDLHALGMGTANGSVEVTLVGLGIGSTTVNSAQLMHCSGGNSIGRNVSAAAYMCTPAAGVSTYAWLECCTNGTGTFYNTLSDLHYGFSGIYLTGMF